MKKRLRLSAICLAGLLGAACPQGVLAAPTDSPEFSRTPEEWARLRDNKLEYDEIPDLIHEYNVTVLNNRTSYRDYLGDTPSDITQRYRDAATELRNNIQYPDDPTDISYATMLMAAQMNETQAQSLEKQADTNVDDAQSVRLQYQQVEENLVFSTKMNLISYYQKQLTGSLNQEHKKLLEVLYQSAVLQASIGNGTQMEVLSARQAIEQLDSVIISDERELQTLKQKICLATGWSYDGNPEFGELPELDLSLIDQIDLAAGQAQALESSYALKISRRQYENSTDQATKENLEKTIHDNQQKISSDVTTKYQALLTAKASYELALAEQAIETQNMEAASRRLQAGTASRIECEQQEYALYEKDTAVKTAKLNLLSAWETYQAAVNGLASAS